MNFVSENYYTFIKDIFRVLRQCDTVRLTQQIPNNNHHYP
jgi:hypothetical protein